MRLRIVAFAMCLQFQVKRYSMPCTAATAICSASSSAARGTAPLTSKLSARTTLGSVNSSSVVLHQVDQAGGAGEDSGGLARLELSLRSLPRFTRGSSLSFVRPALARTARGDHAATSIKTSGWRSAIFNNCFAAPDGSRRPCSHCSSVRLETPRAAANSD